MSVGAGRKNVAAYPSGPGKIACRSGGEIKKCCSNEKSKTRGRKIAIGRRKALRESTLHDSRRA